MSIKCKKYSYIEKNIKIEVCDLNEDINFHTMGSYLKEYVFQKFPIEEVKNVIKNKGTFEIYNNQLYALNNFSKHYYKINFHYKENRLFNYIRPDFYLNNSKNKFIISLVPGKDYLMHYTRMLNYVLHILKYKTNVIIRRYLIQESKITLLTGLNSNFIEKDDIVIIGSVDKILNYLLNNKNFIFIYSYNNDYYTSYKFRINNKIINLLGVKFSFWGDISSKIVNKICQLEAKEIIYVSKLGTLTSVDDIYKKIFIPNKTFFMNDKNIIYSNTNINKKFLSYFNNFSTGLHLSVPTIMEETTIQRNIAKKLNINSIDNEIAQIANCIDNYNNLYCKNIEYTSLHFATDYLKYKSELLNNIKFNLSNNRSKIAQLYKNEILDKIISILIEYLLINKDQNAKGKI